MFSAHMSDQSASKSLYHSPSLVNTVSQTSVYNLPSLVNIPHLCVQLPFPGQYCRPLCTTPLLWSVLQASVYNSPSLVSIAGLCVQFPFPAQYCARHLCVHASKLPSNSSVHTNVCMCTASNTNMERHMYTKYTAICIYAHIHTQTAQPRVHLSRSSVSDKSFHQQAAVHLCNQVSHTHRPHTGQEEVILFQLY